MPATLSKCEILRSKKDIDTLFMKGRSLSQFPLRMCYLQTDREEGIHILVSVPKRYFKRAVKRNLLKRRIREAFRLHKDQFAAPGMDVAFIYTAHEEHSYQRIEESVCKLIAAASTPAAPAESSEK